MGAHKNNPFARGNSVGSGGMRVRDRFGRELAEGDEVILPNMELKAPTFAVAAIKPNLAPQAPPNSLTVVLRTQIIISVGSNKPVNEVIRVRTMQEIQELFPGAAVAGLSEGEADGDGDATSEAAALPAPDGPKLIKES